MDLSTLENIKKDKIMAKQATDAEVMEYLWPTGRRVQRGQAMNNPKITSVGIAAALLLFSALLFGERAEADCLRGSSGVTICGQGPCAKDRYGKVSCALERYGSAVRNQQGQIVCGLGQCVKNMYGEILCSRDVGGGATRGIDGVKCLGGCEPATPAHCERITLE